MVTSATSLGKNGLSDWMVQRVSAVILGVYFICVMSFMIANPDLSFAEWKAYMGSAYMKIFTFLALISLAGHAWVGMWTVSTDYLTERQLGSIATPLRIVFQLGTILIAVVYVLWGSMIIWSA